MSPESYCPASTWVDTKLMPWSKFRLSLCVPAGSPEHHGPQIIGFVSH